jgi:hypothetical protein
MATAQEVIQQLRAQYYELHNRLDDLLDACGNDDLLKREVGEIMDESFTNYLKAQNRILIDNAPQIDRIAGQVREAEVSIRASLRDLKHIKEILDKITTAIKVVGIAIAAAA